MNKNQEKIITLVLTDIDEESIVNEEYIKEKIGFFSILYPLTEEESSEIVKVLHSKLSIRMDRGACIKEKNHKTWYYSAKKSMTSDFWERYRTHLTKDKGFNANVINSLDKATDEMMDMLGNPVYAGGFSRRGLIIGDVQSGKTATYVALINKAADAGYKIIILLTGTIEKLRRQTQSRLDEGFIGLDSTAFIRDKNNIRVGVGNIDPSIAGWAVTSTSSDFNTSTASKLNGQLSGINQPVLFVLKKNKTVLEKLEQWLRLYNADVNKQIHMPMLLIDDEADNASINTKKEEYNPTTINANIRKLLKLFVKSNYVGFTATPFANIFINPDSEDEMLKDDLFPRDFIYALEPPTDYVGARSIFDAEGAHSYMLKNNDDCELYLPEKHTKEYILENLPLSLKEAIVSFFIANAVRDLRGDITKHRSMLINISRFIAVQNNITAVVDEYVRDLQREIKNYHLIGSAALKYESISFTKSVFDNHFANIKDFKFSWYDIQIALYNAVAPIVVRAINGGNAPKNLNYDEFEEEGLRLIAVGGYSLSRGLTLEGLCISYFYRNSKMYDTLMQMGRWFGYRSGYEDICQLWMGEAAVDWYSYISVASDELRHEVKRMDDANMTPIDFGLAVRSDINALLVTARNKMRTAKDYRVSVSLNGKMIETPYIHLDNNVNQKNKDILASWLNELSLEGYKFDKDDELALDNYHIRNLPKRYILDLLSAYKSHYLNMDFKTSNLINLISNYDDGTVDKWDIVVAEGRGLTVDFNNIKISCILRRFKFKEESKALQLSGNNSRLGSSNLAKGGLTKEQAKDIEEKERIEQMKRGGIHSFSQELYFNSGIQRNPLLVIYPVELSPKTKDLVSKEIFDDYEKLKYIKEAPQPLYGLSIGIPRISGKKAKVYQYKINMVKFKELFGVSDDFDEIDETISEEDI